MKKLLNLIIIFSLVLSTMSFATDSGGDGNLDGDGGDIGGGGKGNHWNVGDDGVRVTIVDVVSKLPVTTPIDYTKEKPKDIKCHFNKVSKIQYRNNVKLSPNFADEYTSKLADPSMPRII